MCVFCTADIGTCIQSQPHAFMNGRLNERVFDIVPVTAGVTVPLALRSLSSTLTASTTLIHKRCVLSSLLTAYSHCFAHFKSVACLGLFPKSAPLVTALIRSLCAPLSGCRWQ